MSLERPTPDEADARRITELRATAHPLRLQMLSLLTGTDMSAAEVARELEITQANASYHLRVLHGAGLLEITGEESVRGGRAKKYRHPWERDLAKHRGTPDDATVRTYMAALAQALVRRDAERLRQGPASSSDAELWVRPDVWQECVGLLTEASRLLHAGAEPPRTPGTIRTSLSIAAFRMTTTSREDPPG